MKRKIKQGNSGFPRLKKDIDDFLLSEEGKITRKKIVRMGIGLAILAAAIPAEDAFSQTHSSGLLGAGRGGHSSHTSHASHASHASHGSHGVVSW